MAPRPGEALGNYDAGIKSAITPTPDAALPGPSRGVYVGVSGNLTVQFVGDNGTVQLVGLAAGVWHPMQIVMVASGGTSATGILVGF